MRIDTFGLPVPVKYQDKVKKQIPLTFRRPNKAEAREQEMANLRKACGFPDFSSEEFEERSRRAFEKALQKAGWDQKEEEKEK